MANTYYQLFAHIVFGVYNRIGLIMPEVQPRLHEYLGGILTRNKCKPIIIGGTADHVHILVGFVPDVALSDLVRIVKSVSSKWINDNRLSQGRFEWQRGYGAFTYSRSQLDAVAGYIRNQPEHHRHKTFAEEFKEFLNRAGIEYDDRYLPHNPV